MDIGSCKSAYNGVNIVNIVIVKIIEIGIFSYYVFEEL